MPDESAAAIDPVAVARAALETLVFAPIGLGAKIVDDGPSAVRRVRQELRNAQFVGRLTVEQGAARLRHRSSDHNEASAAKPGGKVIEVADSATLPIEGYDEMPAIEIVGMLDALTPAQRVIVAAHEGAHRQRRTVLGKIAQLAE